MNADESQRVRELQFLEHTLQNILIQKQSLELERNELTNAITELASSTEDVYRVIGNIMVRATKPQLKKDIEEKQRVITSRLNAIEKQEAIIELKASELQKNPSSSQREKN